MEQAGIKQIEIEVVIDASREHVWQCLFHHFPEWWPKDFLSLKGSETIKFEPFAGGRVYEETLDGQSILWAHLVAVQPGQSLEFVGYMTPVYGGPSLTMWRISLSDADGGKIRCRMVDAIMGRIEDEHQQNLTEGWTYLMENFKAYCEKPV